MILSESYWGSKMYYKHLSTKVLKNKKPPHFCDGFAPLLGLEPATL